MGRIVSLLEHLSFNSPRARIINYFSILLALALIPTEYLQYSPVHSLWAAIGIPAYSIGLTRALSRLLHLDIPGALAYNNLVIPLVITMLILITIDMIKLNKNE